MPPKPVNFVGRGEEIKEINEKLAPSKPTLLLNGIGGVGKTEICRKFFHDNIDKYEYVGWIDYRGNLKDSFITQFDFMDLQEAKKNVEEYYKQIIPTLSSLSPNTLLIVDDITDEKDTELIRLCSFPFNVICTSRLRIEEFEIITTDFLSEENCKELFKKYNKCKDEETELGEIIKLAGKHTLTVELLAKTAANAHITLKQLLELLKEKGFNLNTAIKEKVGMHWHNEVDENLLFEHLQKVFDISGITGEEKNILINLSVLPSVFIDIERIKKWLELKTYNDINSLVKKGWLIEDENNIYCHQTIREVVYNKFVPNADDLKTLIYSLSRELYIEAGENPLSRKGVIDFAKCVCSYIKEEIDYVANLYNNISLRYLDFGKLKEALKFQLKGIEISEKVLDKDNPNLSASYNNLSTIYQHLGKPEEALKYQLKAIEIIEKVGDENQPNLATTYSNLSLIYKDLGRLEEALKYQHKAIEITEKALDKNHPNLAKSYNNLSLIYQFLGKLEEALTYQLKAVEIHKTVLEKDHPDFAQSYNNLSSIYKDFGKLDEALKYQLKAVEINENILDKDHPNLAISYNNLSTIYQDLSKLEDALNYQFKAVEIREKILEKDHPGLAVSYNNLSTIYKALGKPEEALKYQLKTVEIREKVLEKDHPDLAQSYNNISVIYQDLSKLEEALKYQLKAVKINERVLDKYHPNLGITYLTLAALFYELKNKTEAKKYILKSIEIFKKSLPPEHPNIKKALGWLEIINEM